MSLYGYKKKSKPATWTMVPGARRVREPEKKPQAARQRKPVKKVSKTYSASKRQYAKEAREFLEGLRKCGMCCPVVANIPELRNGKKYGHDISDEIKECHHWAGRGHGGRGPLLMDKRLWIGLSKQGHRWVDANREKAIKFGWLCPHGKYNEPVPENAVVHRNQFGGIEVEYPQ